MSEQTIQSQDIKVADVFQAFYVVPDYQREYVWETDQVEQLLNDINAELAGADAAKAPEYFIGSIVVCPGKEGVLDLIDGQQRMTTLFLTLCAIRDRIRELNETPPGALGPQIAATSTDASGRDHFRYRLDLRYEDSGGVVVEIAKGKPRSGEGATTRSIANILNAYDVALGFLKREFGDNVGALRAFYGYLTNKVKLIRIQTEDVAKALKIFETINDRGVGLDSMDLLKNLLFMKADRAQFDKLKDIWKQLQDTIYKMGEKPLRFLRYFIFSCYDVDVLREDEIYGWFSRNEKLCGYASDPLVFAKELLSASRAYCHFLTGCDQHGKKSRYLENLQLLGGKAARQHLILLLAGRHLPDTLFGRLAREVEDLFFVYVITREPTRDFERNFARWAADLRKVTSDAELSDFIERRFASVKADLGGRFDDAFRRLYSNTVQQYRLRYILAKLTQYIELQAFGETEGTKWLSRYTGGGFEIEHIFPRTPSQKATEEFGEFVDSNVTERLGNLALVEKSINASLGQRAYSEKRPVYKESQLLLTRSLSERPKVGVNTKIDMAVADLDPFDTWNEAAVATRQQKLTVLAREIWNVAAEPIGEGNDATY
jgi:Protein of unknown function DUF262/Protein of unknown function (DUF1524)